MDYKSIIDAVPWHTVGLSALQAFTIYVLIVLGLKAVGRRVFSQKSPEDLILLLLISEACGVGLSDQRAGYWGAIIAAFTLLALGKITDRIPALRRFVEGTHVVLYRHRRLDRKVMEKHMISEEDLEEMARSYGAASYRDFNEIVLEASGEISGVLHVRTPIPRKLQRRK